MKKRAVLVDIDGTLVTLTPFDYGVFSLRENETEEDKELRIAQYLDFWDADTMNAEVLHEGVRVLRAFKEQGYTLVFLTARGHGCKRYTKKNFQEIGISDLVDSMWHRPVRWEGKKSSLYKQAMINMLMKKYDFEWAMDDEDANLEMMASFGMCVIDAKGWWK